MTGWLLLACGMVLLGTSVLVPGWITATKLAQQQHMLRAQVRQLGDQEKAYRQFHAGLDQRDPVLLQRLAYRHLYLKPVGTKMLLISTMYPGSAIRTKPHVQETKNNSFTPVDIGVGKWLDQPITNPATETMVTEVQSRLASVVQGPARVTLVASGLICIVMGLMMPINGSLSQATS